MASSCPTASAQLDRRLLCPDSGKISLADYARAWIDERPGLRPKTVELYRYLLRRHLAPILGAMPIADIQPAHVRRWRKLLLDNGISANGHDNRR